MSLLRFSRFLARTETHIVLAALLLTAACIGIGGLIVDRLVALRLFTGTGG
ncbi:hypothetical protein [Methylocaldum sp.]|uniref:hypothetical protein n=1 Tax=unclassified Methylocaldum TaxID=2622260 RepID=UPI00321F750C